MQFQPEKIARNMLKIYLISGVTSINIDDLELPATMTDLDHDTWMLSGIYGCFMDSRTFRAILLI